MPINPSIQHLTEWQSLHREYVEALKSRDKVTMDHLLRYAYDLWFKQRSEIPQRLNPMMYMQEFRMRAGHPAHRKVMVSGVAAWLADLDKFSREEEGAKF